MEETTNAPFKLKRFGICLAAVCCVVALGITTTFLTMSRIQEKRAHETEAHFELWHETPAITCRRGECVEITVYLRSHISYWYFGTHSEFRPYAKLIANDSDSGYTMEFDELPHTDDHATYYVYPYDQSHTVFSVTVPEDAPLGDYDIEMTFKATQKRQPILTIEE